MTSAAATKRSGMMHPTRRPWRLATCAAVLLACSGGTGNDRNLRVGQDPEGAGNVGGSTGSGSGAGQADDVDGGGIASGGNALRVHVENVEEMAIEIITLACAGDCADIMAVPTGGNPPYAIEWEDGSKSAKRHVCLDKSATLFVMATDTAIDDVEFKYEAQMAQAFVTATVLECPDGGIAADGGRCDARPGSLAPEDLAGDIFGKPTYFAGGESLPAGKYRAQYVDGCMKYDASWAWTVQGMPTFQFVLVGATHTDVLGVLPGTAAPIGVGVTGYPVYEDCIAANQALPPLDFDFAGGKLGIWQNDFKLDDNIAGATSPTWRLTQLAVCE